MVKKYLLHLIIGSTSLFHFHEINNLLKLLILLYIILRRPFTSVSHKCIMGDQIFKFTLHELFSVLLT